MPLKTGYAAAALFFVGTAAGTILVKQSISPSPLDRATFAAVYETPVPQRTPRRIYHLGHSLVGRDMPAMFAQLSGHAYDSQLGWGSSLRQHWEPDEPVNGFEVENAHPRYRDAREAVASGDYDAIVVTEALGYRSKAPWRETHSYLRKWALRAWTAKEDTRFYLYTTWRGLDHEGDWLDLIESEQAGYWEDRALRRTLAYQDVAAPIYVVPGGLVMAAFVREVEARGGIGPIKDRTSLFSDEIHFNDYGAYLMALTHYAVLLGRSPAGLPHDLKRADGSAADDPGTEAARLMQDIVWQVVTSYPPTGVAGQ